MGEKEDRTYLINKLRHRGAEALKSAKVLLNDELYADAISRAYYAIYHNLTALLMSLNISTKTHRGTLNLIYLHFVEKSIIEKSLHKKINQILALRADADYGVISNVDATDTEFSISVAKEVIQLVSEILD